MLVFNCWEKKKNQLKDKLFYLNLSEEVGRICFSPGCSTEHESICLDHALPVLLLNNHILLFFSLFFFSLFQRVQLCFVFLYIDEWRWESVNSWILSCFQQVLGVEGAVRSWSQAWLWTGLHLVWSSQELLQVCGGYPQTADCSLCWRGDGQVESCRRDSHRKRAFPPSSVQFACWKSAVLHSAASERFSYLHVCSC